LVNNKITMAKKYQICTRCVMDTSDAQIFFDAQGVCSDCKSYFTRLARDLHDGPEGRRLLEKTVETMKREGKNKPYDCIIGVSGGIDSSYVAYLTKELGLRPLAVHLDNGWDSELAINNIERILKTLDIDLFTHVLDWENFRNLQIAVLRSSTVDCELPTDNAILAALYHQASGRGVRYIIGGTNLVTEALTPSSWAHFKYDRLMLESINSRFSPTKLAQNDYIGILDIAYYTLLKRTRWIPLLNYIRYNKEEAKKIMAKSVGWRDYGGKHYESIYTRFYQGYILPKKFGIDKRRAHYSALICAGQMGRQEALDLLKKDPYESGSMLSEDKEYAIKKLGLTAPEFEAIMREEQKSDAEYSSEAAIYGKLKFFVDWGKRIATSAR